MRCIFFLLALGSVNAAYPVFFKHNRYSATLAAAAAGTSTTCTTAVASTLMPLHDPMINYQATSSLVSGVKSGGINGCNPFKSDNTVAAANGSHYIYRKSASGADSAAGTFARVAVTGGNAGAAAQDVNCHHNLAAGTSANVDVAEEDLTFTANVSACYAGQYYKANAGANGWSATKILLFVNVANVPVTIQTGYTTNACLHHTSTQNVGSVHANVRHFNTVLLTNTTAVTYDSQTIVAGMCQTTNTMTTTATAVTQLKCVGDNIVLTTGTSCTDNTTVASGTAVATWTFNTSTFEYPICAGTASVWYSIGFQGAYGKAPCGTKALREACTAAPSTSSATTLNVSLLVAVMGVIMAMFQ